MKVQQMNHRELKKENMSKKCAWMCFSSLDSIIFCDNLYTKLKDEAKRATMWKKGLWVPRDLLC